MCNPQDIEYLLVGMKANNNKAWEGFQKKYKKYIYKCMRNTFVLFNLTMLGEDLDDCYMGVLERIFLKLDQIPHPNEKAFRKGIGLLTFRYTFNFITRYLLKNNLTIDIDAVKYKLFNDQSLSDNYEIIDFEVCNKILTEEENFIIKFVRSGFTKTEIAKFMNINRQKVHNLEKSAISKLRNYYDIENKNPV